LEIVNSNLIENIRTQKVNQEDVPSLRPLIEDMVNFAKSKNGVGLSAIQIGLSYRLFVAYDFDKNVWKVYFNSVYCPISGSSQFAAMEGCLSYPGKTYLINRYDKVLIQWDELTSEGILSSKTKIFYGRTGQILQHEIDHQDGITIATKGKLI